MNNIFKKINVKFISYASILIVTIALLISLLTWASKGDIKNDINIIETKVHLNQNVRQEYLVGETIDTNGISLEVEGEQITDFNVSCDTSCAGIKKVEISYLKEGNNYVGYYPITILGIRHYDIRSYPTGFSTDSNGKTIPQGLEIWVELSGAPKEFETVNGYETAIKLPMNLVETTLTPNENNSSEYSLELAIGSTKLNYYCVQLEDQLLMLNSQDRVLSFTNKDGGKEKMTLYVTQIESNNGDGEVGAEGYYLFEDAQGKKELLSFKYYLNGWDSKFVSSSFNQGLNDYYDSSDEGYNVSYKGIAFHSDKLSWHKAILNWDN
jgi:hypothetical protein